jgi:RNA polymerase sigma-70 factor, ECF subfamily
MTDVHGQLPEGQTAAMGQEGDATGEDDDELARRAQQDPAAFAALYRRHLNRVYRYLLARLGDVHLAQDVTAQTFLAALESLPSYRRQGTFAAWLLTIARNKAADAFRGRRITVPLETAAQAESTAPSPEAIVASRLELQEVVRALRTVSPERAEALALRFFGGLDAAEVAAAMGKTEAAVKMLVHRAVRDLRERLAYRSEAEP